MKPTLARTTAVIGLWVVMAPLVFRWRLGGWTVASSVLPGALLVLAGGYCALLLLAEDLDETRARLSVSLTSSTLLLGLWLLLSPFLLGILLHPSTYAALLLPGAAVTCLSLANGYFGWREPE
ncbi:MAG: hypothetical protein ACYC5O_06385 [Anaerolineae bacterium]